MNHGPEDSKAWQEKEAATGAVVTVCVSCSEDIVYWHCDEKGCPWCKACGAKANPNKKAG